MSVVGTGAPNALYSQLIISLQLPLSTHHLIASLFFLHLPSPFILRVFSLPLFIPFPLHLHSPTPQQARWRGVSLDPRQVPRQQTTYPPLCCQRVSGRSNKLWQQF